MKKIYIIVLNYNGYEDTVECLQSLYLLENDFRIILIDNNSTDDSVKLLSIFITNTSLFEPGKLIFIKSKENNGYAAGNNIGLEYILKQDDADFIWILNNDTIVEKETLNQLIKTYEEVGKNNKVGFIGSKIVDYYNTDIIQSSGVNLNFFGKRKDKYSKKNKSLMTTDFEVNDVCGCSIFFSKQILLEIGLLPEEYFLYYEETDWMSKAKALGYKIFTSSCSVVYHKEAKSTGGRLSPFVIYYMTRNRIKYNKKYRNNLSYSIFIIGYLITSMLKTFIYIYKNRKVANAILIGFFDGIKDLNYKTYSGK